MAQVCCVVGCDATSSDVTYFKFPTSLTLKRKWLSAVRVDGKVTVDSVVCNRHFEPSDYEFVRGKHRLKGKVVPNVPSVVPKVPRIVSDVSSVVTDNPIVVTDNPIVVTGNPIVVTDNPSVVTDNPSVVTDNPSVVTDIPSVVTDIPSVVTDVPSVECPSKKSSEESSPPVDNKTSNNSSEETQLENIEEENKQKGRGTKLSPETVDKNVSIKNGEIENTLVKDRAETKEDCGKENDSDSATSLGITNLDRVSMVENGESKKNNCKKTKKDRVSKKKKKLLVNSKSSKTIQDDTIDIHKQDLEEIITNYQIKQVRRPRDGEDSSERRSNGTELDLTHGDSNDCVDLGYDYFKQPTYVEIPMDQDGAGGGEAEGARDCLMVLESVQVDVDPALLLASDGPSDGPSDDEQPGPQKADPISLLTSSDEDDVIIQEPHIDTFEVSDETDDDDVPLVRLLKASAKQTTPVWSPRQLHCPHCSYKATSKEQLKSHRASHTTTLHICNACDYSTTSKSQYSKHKRKHRTERTFRCDVCSYKAKHRMSLLYHLRTHSVKELCNINSKLVCDKCGFVAVNYVLLKKHRHVCTSSKKYSCDVCMYVTKRPSDLRRHRTRKHKCQDSDEDYVPSSEVILD